MSGGSARWRGSAGGERPLARLSYSAPSYFLLASLEFEPVFRRLFGECSDFRPSALDAPDERLSLVRFLEVRNPLEPRHRGRASQGGFELGQRRSLTSNLGLEIAEPGPRAAVGPGF